MAEESAGTSRRRPRVLSAETKWEIFLRVTTGEIAQADAAPKWMVDVSTALAALAAPWPGVTVCTAALSARR